MIEQVVLCAPDGTPVGVAPKAEVHHGETPLHLAFSCYVVDRAGRVLVTRRARHKAVFPGIRTNSCCGHPAPGESLADAVRRRLRQELGLAAGDVDLLLPGFRYRAVAADGTVENELCPVYRVTIDTAGAPDPAGAPGAPDPAGAPGAAGLAPDPDEVDDVWWEPWADLVAARPDDPLSPWAARQVARLAELGADPRAWPVGDPAELPAAARHPSAVPT